MKQAARATLFMVPLGIKTEGARQAEGKRRFHVMDKPIEISSRICDKSRIRTRFKATLAIAVNRVNASFPAVLVGD